MIKQINFEAERIAKAILSVITKPKLTIHDLIKWIEYNFNCEIKVKYTGFDNKPCSGLVYEDSRYSNQEKSVYQIWINKDEYWRRQRFTLCHELGHILQCHSSIYGFLQGDIETASGVERFCNRFAAAFLMPAEDFKKLWKLLDDELIIKIFKISRRFRVSLEAVRYRASELDLLNI